MTRTAAALLLATALALTLAASAQAANVDVRGTWNFECSGLCGPQTHTFQTQDPVSGDLTGTGRSASGSVTWTITGKVTESSIQFTIDYDDSTYEATLNGTVSADNQHIAGTFTDNSGHTNQPFTMNRVAGADPPPPEPGKSVNARPVTGTVKAKCKGDDGYEVLDDADQLPVGCLLDTRKGTVNITASTGQGDETVSSWFWQGIFKVSQKKGVNQETVVALAGALENCPKTKKGSLQPAAKRGRRLWGKGKGRFSTRGRRGSAAVRGTEWLVVDNCDDTTSVTVKEGSVNFRDFFLNKTVVVKQGKKYTARRR